MGPAAMRSGMVSRRARQLAVYTLAFAVFALLAFGIYAVLGRNFIYGRNGTGDGFAQHYVRLLYINRTVRGAFASLLAGNGFAFPEYDFRQMPAMQDLQIGFPQILAALVPERLLPEFYVFYVLLAVWMAGAGFLALAEAWGIRFRDALPGAMAYAFCPFALHAGPMHPHFAVAMGYLALMMAGTEWSLRRKRLWLLPAAVFLCATAQWGLYWTCVCGALCAAYGLLRKLFSYGSRKGLLRDAARTAGLAGLGLGLAAFVAFPSAVAVLSSGRAGSVSCWDYFSFWHYDAGYYASLVSDFLVSPFGSGDLWKTEGFSAAVALPAAYLAFKGRDRAFWRAWLGFLLACYCLPLAGYVLSGFSNPSDRFGMCMALALSLALSASLEELRHADGADLVRCAMIAAMPPLAGAVLIDPFYGVIALFVAACAFAMAVCAKRAPAAIGRSAMACAFLSLGVSAACLHGMAFYAFEFRTDPEEALAGSAYASAGRADLDGFHRTVAAGADWNDLNLAFYYNADGLTAYPYAGWSVGLRNWMQETGSPCGPADNRHMFSADGMDGWQLAWLCAGEIAGDVADAVEPCGFRDGVADRVLPVGRLFYDSVPEAAWAEMSPLEKRMAMLQGAVSDEAGAVLSGAGLRFPWREADAVLSVPDGVVLDGDGFSFDGSAWPLEGVRVSVSFEADPGERVYLEVSGAEAWDLGTDNMHGMECEASGPRGTASFMKAGGRYFYASGQEQVLLDMGTSAGGDETLELSFSGYPVRVGGVRALLVREDAMDAYLDGLAEQEVSWTVGNDAVEGTVRAEADACLAFSMPWMPGWSVRIDGEPAEIFPVAGAFVGVLVPEGEHAVGLEYRLPGLRSGAAVSLASWLGIAAWTVLARRKRRA